MTRTIAIGPYTETDLGNLIQEFEALSLPSPEALSKLPEVQRAGFAALAYMGHAPFGAEQMDMLPGLKVIANYGVGYDAIDVAAATARRILVTNTPDVLSDDVADLAVALILGQARGIVGAAAHVMSGKWAAGAPLPLGRKVSGTRIGVLGLGRIGRAIADRMAAFGCEIHYWSRSAKTAPEGWIAHGTPQELAAQSDFLVVALVGGAATQGMVSREVIASLPETSVVVNISRGSTIDEEALIEALQSKQIAGAALDVMLNEPNVDQRLLTLPNVLLLPHIGSATAETRAEMAALQRHNIAAVLAGEMPPTPVNASMLSGDR